MNYQKLNEHIEFNYYIVNTMRNRTGRFDYSEKAMIIRGNEWELQFFDSVGINYPRSLA